MKTIITPSPSLHPARPGDGTLFYALWDAVAEWGWGAVTGELAEVARVRGDQEMMAVMAMVTTMAEKMCAAPSNDPNQEEN